MKTAIAIRHVHFEDLGSLAPLLAARGMQIRYVEAGATEAASLNPLRMDLLVVLGGPIGACEQAIYPCVGTEISMLERRLAAARPTLGICLGSQLMARALGARVFPSPVKEIGWAPLVLTEAGRRSAVRHLDGERTSMLHWHGDTFDLPEGATLLASTAAVPHQVYSFGKAALAFQCHPEITVSGFEHWLIGHAAELTNNGINVNQLRADTAAHARALGRAAAQCLDEWLAGIGL